MGYTHFLRGRLPEVITPKNGVIFAFRRFLFFFANGLPRYSSPFNSPVPNIFFRKSILNKQIKVLCCSFSTKPILRGCEKKTPTFFFVNFGWPKKGKIYEFQFSKSYLLDPGSSPIHPDQRMLKTCNTTRIEAYQKHMSSSDLCLAPRGNQVWSPRLFEFVWYGCIPAPWLFVTKAVEGKKGDETNWIL